MKGFSVCLKIRLCFIFKAKCKAESVVVITPAAVTSAHFSNEMIRQA